MAKRVPPLSALKISKTTPHPKRTIELVDGAVPGLRLRILPSGTRTWSLAMRANGVMRRFEVGTGLGLSAAREKAQSLRLEIQSGADPTAAKRIARMKAISAVEGSGTFGSVIDAYFTIGNGALLKTRDVQRKHLKSVFCRLVDRHAMDIKSSEIQLLIDAHPAKVSSARAAAYLRPILKWASKRDLVQGSFDLEKPITPAPLQRVLTNDELAKLLPTFDDAYGRCCKFMLLTACRRGEAIAATWNQIDLRNQIWTIPGSDRKDTRSQSARRARPKDPMAVPLSQQAMALLKSIQMTKISGSRTEPKKNAQETDQPIFKSERGGALSNWSRWLVSNTNRSRVGEWSPHALRRTSATIAGNLGAPPHVISAMLGHTNIGGQLVAGYNKSRYAVEHAEIVQLVANRLEAIETDAKASENTSFD